MAKHYSPMLPSLPNKIFLITIFFLLLSYPTFARPQKHFFPLPANTNKRDTNGEDGGVEKKNEKRQRVNPKPYQLFLNDTYIMAHNLVTKKNSSIHTLLLRGVGGGESLWTFAGHGQSDEEGGEGTACFIVKNGNERSTLINILKLYACHWVVDGGGKKKSGKKWNWKERKAEGSCITEHFCCCSALLLLLDYKAFMISGETVRGKEIGEVCWWDWGVLETCKALGVSYSTNLIVVLKWQKMFHDVHRLIERKFVELFHKPFPKISENKLSIDTCRWEWKALSNIFAPNALETNSQIVLR